MPSEVEDIARDHDDAPVATSKTAEGDRTLLAESVTINRPALEL